MAILSLAEWDVFLKDHPNTHLLQTGEWGKLKSSFGWTPVPVVEGSLGAMVLFRQLPLGLSAAYIPRGPVYGNPHPDDWKPFWTEIDRVCRQRHAVFLKVEPDCWDEESAVSPVFPDMFQLVQKTIQPPRTILVDLTGNEADWLAHMKQKTRYNIRLAEKKGVVIRDCEDVDTFIKLMETTGERDKFGIHEAEYYKRAYQIFKEKGNCALLLAYAGDEPLAGIMLFWNGTRAWYLYGASSDASRNLMPTYLLQWEGMRLAKAKGCDTYDLYGVPDASEEELESQFEKRSDGLWGVYRFKRGFGGVLRRSSATHDRVYLKGLYRLYQRF